MIEGENTSLLLGPIIGGMTEQSVNIWGRIAPTQEENICLHAWIGHQVDLSDATLAGKSLPLCAEQGYAGVVPIRGLSPDTEYHYALTLDEKPPKPSSGALANGIYPLFQTFPLPKQQASFNFAFGSCFCPKNLAGGQIFYSLEKRRQMDNLRFLILLGDQVYADDYGTNSLGKIAETVGEYRDVYHFIWSRPPLRRLFWTMPVFMTLDDHEVDDDWRWRDPGRTKPYIPWWDGLKRLFAGRPASERTITPERVKSALQAYWEHQGMHAPSLLETPVLNDLGGYSLPENDPGSLAYTFEFGNAAFFVMDTRTMRVRPLGRGHRTMLGTGQWERLKSWLLQVKDSYAVKFIISSCSLLYSSWLDFPRDRWAGYPNERDHLLNFIAENAIQGVFVLSGDYHFAYAIEAELYTKNGSGVILWEFCSSPFEQGTSKLALRTRTNISDGLLKRQECKFTYPAHNFGVIKVNIEDSANPKVGYELYDANGKLVNRIDAS